MRSSTETIIEAMKILSHDIYCEDGVATAAIAEAADRLEEIAAENKKLKTELQEAKDYADKLVEHKDMVCLPADLANLREANARFAMENHELQEKVDKLKLERDGWREAAYSLAEAIPASWEELQPAAEQLRKFKEMVALQNEKTKNLLDIADKHSKMYP